MNPSPALSVLSGHDQTIQIFTEHFNLPVEITILVFSHLSIINLHKTLGATLDQLVAYVRKTGFEQLKCQLMEHGGYQIKDDGSKSPICTLVVYLFNFRMGLRLVS